MSGALCQYCNAEYSFHQQWKQPRVVEFWQIVTVVYLVFLPRTKLVVVGRSCGHRIWIDRHARPQRLHAVAPSTRGYNDSRSTHGDACKTWKSCERECEREKIQHISPSRPAVVESRISKLNLQTLEPNSLATLLEGSIKRLSSPFVSRLWNRSALNGATTID